MDGFGDFYGQTSLHPFALFYVISLATAALVLPRRLALLPLFLGATTAPMGQRIVVAGSDLTLLRLLLLAYVLRILLRKELRDVQWNKQDLLVLLWVIAGTLVMTIHFGGERAAIINRAGWSYDILLTYVSARALVRDRGDLLAFCRYVALISLPIALLFLIEMATRQNLFAVFGGVPFETRIREGRLRCQGPFAHAILAGTFWASTLPCSWVLWKEQGFDRHLAILGTTGALVIIIACASSTPLLTTLVALVGLAAFSFRQYRKAMWIGVIAILLVLHFFLMNNPVWHLLARVDVLGGSTGWHRYIIFDTFVAHFKDWWLTGNHQPGAWRWEMRDITNQYILEGLRGGLVTLVIFVALLLSGFSRIGRALQYCESKASAEPADERCSWMIWMVGVALLIHVVTFWAVSYFGQMVTIFYIQLAFCAAALGFLPEASGAYSELKEADADTYLPPSRVTLNEKGLLGRSRIQRGLNAGWQKST